jgi:hypothetical protein
MTNRSGPLVFNPFLLGCALLAMVMACGSPARAQSPRSQESSEYLIKAGYVYNFAKLVEWPSSAFRNGGPLVVGILGNDAFANVVARVVEGKRIDDRPLQVKRVTAKDFKECGCQILFVAGAESAPVEDVIRFQNAASVLTIAETPEFTRRGGVIALTLEDRKVRFMVNTDAATQASLAISSRLLTLASVVHTTR